MERNTPIIITAGEFKKNMSSYLKMAENGRKVVISRGKNNYFEIVPKSKECLKDEIKTAQFEKRQLKLFE